MRDPQSNLRVSFLAGAGLSMDATLPSSVGLAEKLKQALSEKATLIPTVPNELLQELVRFLNGGIRFQRGILNLDPDRAINIEELATAALRLKARMENPISAYASGWHNRLMELESKHPRLLDSLLDAIYERLAIWLGTPELNEIAYLTRIIEFKNAGYCVNVFTLNYDLLIESALQSRSEPFVNGMHDTRAEWAPDTFENESQIRLFKLHGSLDWVDHENYGVCSLSYPKHTNSEEFIGDQKPLIIFGTDQKLTSKEPFISLLYRFSIEIKKTDLLIVIGYSFADAHVNEVLSQRMRENLNLKVLIVHPKAADVLTNMHEFENNPRVTLLNKKAKEAFNDGLIFVKAKELLEVIEDEKPF